MRHVWRMCLVIISLALLAGCGSPIGKRGRGVNPPTIVIVHGAWGGGWAFREVEDLLRAQGYRVYRPTLTGQGERVHLASREVGLDTHIRDVANTILFEELDDIILVGHSYGGMVITGVADRLPEKIGRLVYLDAMVPFDGESVVKNLAWTGNPWWSDSIKDGFIIPAWVKEDQAPPKDVPHPLKAFAEPIDLKNFQRLDIPTDYILTVDRNKKPQEDDFYAYCLRAKQYGWPVHLLMADHNPQQSCPKELADLLIGIARP